MWSNLPEELRLIPKWCIAAPDKSPYTISGQRASVTNPATWTDWYSASTISQQWGNGAGIGFILSEDDEFTCIDLDVKDADNEPDTSKHTTPQQLERYQRIIDAFDSYTELSRSGKGVHIWIKGKVGTGCRRDGVEVYSQQRFIICTGNAIRHRPVEHRQELLDLLVAEIRDASQSNSIQLTEVESRLTDEEMWEKASTAANADKFISLWGGDWSAMGYPSQSEADLSLLSMLAFYSKSNEQVRRLFRMSGLGKRAKAVKNDRYIDRTLAMIRGRQERENVMTEISANNARELLSKVASEPEIEPLIETDWPPGRVGEIARWMYSIAPRPVKEVAIVSAIGLFSGIMGRCYNINGSGLNLYIVLVARSAIGKEAMHSGISKLVSTIMPYNPAISNYVDFADYASGPALVKAIVQRNSFVNVAGEWGRKLRKMSDDHTEGPMATLRTVMTNLYQKSGAGNTVGGIGYSNKDSNIQSTSAVAYSMIGETTPDTFYESLTNSMMQDGFLSRFIVIEYNGLRPELNTVQSAPVPDEALNNLINILDNAYHCPVDKYIDIAMSREAQGMLDAFDKECDKQINMTDDESWRQMWNRAHLKALKLCGLLAGADNHSAPCVMQHHAEWALAVVKRDIRIMSRKMLDGDVGDGDMVRERKLLATLKEYMTTVPSKGYGINEAMRSAGVVPRKYLQIRLQRVNCFARHRMGQNIGLDSTIKSLIDSGYMSEVSKEQISPDWGFQGRCFRILSIPG